ncbi:phosphotransferase [Robbsia sp. KACC 23696]|uniref:phosphotransferase enzyme family protein n=1 Tax=Robbsia sp. KACC 23696 TaxID=3149231 RepID=UPI00325B7B3C
MINARSSADSDWDDRVTAFPAFIPTELPSSQTDAAVYTPAYPAATTRLAPDDVVAIVARYYEVGSVRLCEFERASYNEVYRISLSDGVTVFGRLERIVKVVPKNVPYEFALLTVLAKANLPVCAAIPLYSGEWTVTIAVPGGLKHFTLFEEVRGIEPLAEETSLRMSGAGLANLHNASLKVSLLGQPAAMTLDASFAKAFDTVLSSHLLDERGTRAYLELKARLDTLQEESRSDRSHWRRGHFHGDPYRNRLEQRDENERLAIAFIDFDDAAPGYLALDLANFFEELVAAHKNRRRSID